MLSGVIIKRKPGYTDRTRKEDRLSDSVILQIKYINRNFQNSLIMS